MSTSSALSRFGVLVLMVSAIGGVAACGSDDSSDSGSNTAATGNGSESTGGLDPTKTYVEGVPTLEELRSKGTETEPPSSGPAAKPNVTVAWVSCGQASVGCKDPSTQADAVAEKLNWDLKVLDGKLSPDAQQAAIRSAIASKVDAIALYAVDCPDVAASLKEAKAANIPVLGVSSLDCDAPTYGAEATESLFTAPMYYGQGAETSSDFFSQWGQTQAEYLVNAMQGKGQIITVPYASSFGNVINDAWKEVIGKCSECEVVESVPWTFADQAGALKPKIDTALVKNPTATGVLFPFDSTAASDGGAQAILSTGRADKIISVAGEGTSEAQQLISGDKGLDASGAALDLTWLAYASLDNLNRHLQGEDPAVQGLGFHAVDKTNLTSGGGAVKSSVDYESAYESIWNGE